MTRELVFVGDTCHVAEPGRRFDTELPPARLAALLPAAGTATSDAAGTATSDAARILSARARGTYLDYAADDALDVDRDIMSGYLRTDPAPPVETAGDGPRVWLPHPAFARSPGPLNAVAELLLLGFGVLRDADFLGLFEVPIKVPPSKGARHPFNAQLVIGPAASQDLGLPAGVYRYVPSQHTLEMLPVAGPTDVATALVVTVVFERAQWRYREVAGYCDVLLDLGHLIETVRVGAAALGLALTPIGVPIGVGTTPLVEEVVLVYDVANR